MDSISFEEIYLGAMGARILWIAPIMINIAVIVPKDKNTTENCFHFLLMETIPNNAVTTNMIQMPSGSLL
jgi:hypothetical protein